MPSLREPRWGVSPAPNLTIRCLAFDESSNHDLVLVGVNGGHCAYALGAADGAVRATLPLHAPSSNPVVDDDCQATAIVSIPRHYAAVVACGTTGRHAVVDLLSATYVASFGCAVASGRRGSEAEATVVSLAVTDNDRRLVSASSSSITVWAYDVWPTFSVVASATISNASGAVKRAFFCTPTTIGATLTTKELKVWSMCSVGTSQTKLHDLVPVEVPPPPVQVAHAHRVAPVKGCERVLAVSDCGDWVVGWISTPSPFHPKTTITWQNSSSDATTMMHLAPAVANQGTATVMLTPRDIAILSFTGTPQLTVVDTVTAQSSTESIALPPTQVMASSQRHQLLLTAHAQSLLALPITLDAAPPLSNDSDLHHADAMPSMPRVMIDRDNDVYIRCVDWSPSEFGNFSVEYSYVNKDPAQVHRSVVVGFREVQSVMCVRRDTRLVASHVPRSHDYCSLPLRPINATQWALLGRELATADFCLATVPNADASLSDQPEWVTAWACANHTIECARSEDRKAVASAMCVQAAVLGELGDRGTAANRREWCHIFLDGHATQLQRLKAAVRVDPLCSEGWLALATWEPPAAATSGSNFCAAPCNAARNGCHGGLDDEVEEDPLDEEDEAPLDRLGCALKAVEMLPDEAKAWEALCECFALHPALQVEVGLAQGIAPDANAAKTAIISEAHALCQYLSLRCDDAAAWARLAKVSWPSRYVELGPRTLDDSPLMYGGGERAELPTMVPADCSWRASELGFKSPSYLAAFW